MMIALRELRPHLHSHQLDEYAADYVPWRQRPEIDEFLNQDAVAWANQAHDKGIPSAHFDGAEGMLGEIPFVDIRAA